MLQQKERLAQQMKILCMSLQCKAIILYPCALEISLLLNNEMTR